MLTIKSKDISVYRLTCIGLGRNVKRVISLKAIEKEYEVVRDHTRNKAFNHVLGYKVVWTDPIRRANEGALYYIDYHQDTGDLIFVQGTKPIQLRAVYSVQVYGELTVRVLDHPRISGEIRPLPMNPHITGLRLLNDIQCPPLT
jgi:hypothetical protein